MKKNYLTKTIKEIVLKTGFHKVGVAPARNPTKSAFLDRWLKSDFQGEMSWMENYQDKRRDIQKFFPGAKSVICVAHNYYSPEKHGHGQIHAKISRYAWGEDYHRIMKKKLKQILIDIQKIDSTINGRICVDTAPIMEKLWAEKAGIGWQGKHTNIISKEFGSWIFLGEIVIDKEVNYDKPHLDYCGNCTACIDACPTQAIIEPYFLDAKKCISYLTIEYWDKPIPKEFERKINNWIFGCDICQDVCPWNKFKQVTDEPRYLPRKENIKPRLNELSKITDKEYKQRFKKSPVLRPGWKNFVRNVKAAI